MRFHVSNAKKQDLYEQYLLTFLEFKPATSERANRKDNVLVSLACALGVEHSAPQGQGVVTFARFCEIMITNMTVPTP